MPAVDRATGKVLLASKDRVALSPDGHGGTLAALAAPGPDGTPSCLDEMRDARRADALLLPGGQSAGSDRRTVVHRPAPRGRTPRCRSRSSSGSRPRRSWAWS